MIKLGFTVKVHFEIKIEMKANQVYNFSTGFKFPQNFLLMNYKLNKTHNHTWKSNADLSRINSWGHKLYINGLL